MTIGPGTAWSVSGFLPDGAAVFESDSELSSFVDGARRLGETMPIVGLTGGTLWATVGGPSVVGRLHTANARHYPVDIVRALVDDRERWFVCSLVARTGRWRDAVVVMNTPWVRGLRLGHRSHPGDALLDITEGSGLTFDDLRRIVPRARNGAHLPHPKLQERRVPNATWEFATPRRISIDGTAFGKGRRLDVQVEPDALIVVV